MPSVNTHTGWFLALIMCVLAVYGYYSHLALQGYTTDLYAQLGQAFLSGNTYLDRVPPYALKTLSDPYDPSINAHYIWQDISYFNHKFYVYFGPAPALLVWIPVYKLTGISLSDGAILALFAAMGTTVLISLLYLIAKRQQMLNTIGFTFVALSVAFGSWILFLLREPMFYEVAIAGAYAFSMLGALCLWLYTDERKALGWLIAASLCLGIAVACRSTHLANSLILLCVLLYVLRTNTQHPKLQILTASLLPYAACLVALGVYNYVRFGNPLDMGWRYVLTIVTNMHSPEFAPLRPELLFANLYQYLFKPLTFTGDLQFPFFEKPVPTTPWGHQFKWYQELLAGLWVNSPFALFYLWMVVRLKQIMTWQKHTQAIVIGLGLYNLILFGFLQIYFFSTARYMVDFAPLMMGLGGLYYLHLLHALPQKRMLLLWLGGLLAAYSIFTGVVLGYCSYKFWP